MVLDHSFRQEPHGWTCLKWVRPKLKYAMRTKGMQCEHKITIRMMQKIYCCDSSTATMVGREHRICRSYTKVNARYVSPSSICFPATCTIVCILSHCKFAIFFKTLSDVHRSAFAHLRKFTIRVLPNWHIACERLAQHHINIAF
jgi:hypothetical protein